MSSDLPEGAAIAVTGASGWVGSAVCIWLAAQGREVRRLVRRPRQPGEVAFDLRADDAATWAQALRGCDVVLHCAAHVHRPIETAAEVASFQAVNVDGTARLLRACQEAGVRRFVLAGSSSVYDWTAGQPVAEDAPKATLTAYATSKLRGEELVAGSELDWRIGRLATVYGAGDAANFNRLARALQRRRFLIPGRGDARKSVLPIARAGELLGRLALEDAAAGVTVNLAAPVAPSLAEICAAFSRGCGFPPAPRVPLVLLRPLAAAGSLAQACGVPFPLTLSTLGKLTHPTVLDVRRQNTLFPDLKWVEFADTIAADAAYYRGDRPAAA